MRQTGHMIATGLLLLLATLVCSLGNFMAFFDDHGASQGEFSRRGHGKLISVHQARMGQSHQRFHKVNNDGGGPLDRTSVTSLLSPHLVESTTASILTTNSEEVAQPLRRWLLFCALLI